MKIDNQKLGEKLQEIDMPEPERLAILRVCSAIGLLKNDLVGSDAEDYYKIRAERDELKAWKESQLTVERTWDVQEVGKEMHLPLGDHIRPAILPYIRRIKKVMIAVLRRSPIVTVAEDFKVCVYCEQVFHYDTTDHLGQHKETCPWQIAVMGECRR